MNETELTPAAQILVDAYLNTRSYSVAFRDEHGHPPTLLAKVHHLRSIAQGALSNDARFEVKSEYMEFGRVQFVDLETEHEYLLRSTSAAGIEQAKAEQLFNANMYLRVDVLMLVYGFRTHGLDLSIAGAKRRSNLKRLELSGKPVFIATWPYFPSDGEPFDQSDAYGELGDLGWDEDEGDAAEGEQRP